MITTAASSRPHAPARRVAGAVTATAALTLALGACTWMRPRPPGPQPTNPSTTNPAPRPTRPTPPPTAPPSTVEPGGWRAEMLASVNAERAKGGLKPMSDCASIDRAAQSYAEDLARRNVLDHYGQDGSKPTDRMRAAGYLAVPGQVYMYGAENIAQGYPTVAAVMAGWMSSSGHRANIMASATSHIGMGHAGAFWVQDFGTGGTC